MSAEQVAAAALGGALLTAGATRQALARRSVGRALRSALRDPEPLVRAAAVQTAGENGIGRNARLLLSVASAEQDIWVRQVLAQTVARHQWEPPTARALVDLRIWAKKELMWGRLEPLSPQEAASLSGAGALGEASASGEGADGGDGPRISSGRADGGESAQAPVPVSAVGEISPPGVGSTSEGGFLRERPRIGAAGRGWDGR